MNQVQHTVEVIYGSYKGVVSVDCDENDDLDVVKSKIRSQNSLDFLSNGTFQVKILSTESI
jgi:hypothetical protein